MAKHAILNRGNDIRTHPETVEWDENYALVFPPGDVPQFLPCGHSRGWLGKDGSCEACGDDDGR